MDDLVDTPLTFSTPGSPDCVGPDQRNSPLPRASSPAPPIRRAPSVLQLSCLLFLVPAGAAVANQRLCIGIVLALNTAVSWAVHSPRRGAGRDNLDVLDNSLVAVWVAVNLYLLISGVSVWQTVTSIACALACVALQWLRLQWPPYSHPRLRRHVAMHLMGAGGTCILLVPLPSS